MKVKKNNPFASSWVNEELIKLSKRKHRLLAKRNAGVINNTLCRRIDEVSKKVTELKRQLRDKDKMRKFGSNINSKTRWKNLNDLLGRNKPCATISSIVNSEGEPLSEATDIANAFNDYFTGLSSATRPHSQQSTTPEVSQRFPHSLFLHPATPQEVSSVIGSLKRKKSVGWDNVSTSLLTSCESALSPVLAKLFNLCLSNGYYPTELKKSRVVPIFKKGETTSLNNYRPISILPTVNKVFEKLIYVRLLDHLKRFNFMYERQYGFRALSSTTSCAIDLLDLIYSKMDDLQIVTAVFLDLSKAFDMVEHDRLLSKLDDCGVRGIASKLFQSYLTNRTQFVSVNNTNSNPAVVTRGVPQGSILGPLLFVIYVNNISMLPLAGKSFLFADDTALIYSSPSPQINCNMAESDLVLLNQFFAGNGLNLNTDKTKVMHFRTNRNNTENLNAVIRLNGQIIETVSSFKYLGVILDSHLTWNCQIDNVSAKIKQIVAILYRAKDLIPTDVRRLLYFSMIHSHLRYMIELWGAASMTHLKRIQVMQNRAIRNILQLPFLTPRDQLYGNPSLDVLPVKGLYENSLAIFVYKRLKGLILSELNFDTSGRTHLSRYGCCLRKPKCRLNIGQRRVSYAGPTIFNSLPMTSKDTNNFTTFRRECYINCKSKIAKYLHY